MKRFLGKLYFWLIGWKLNINVDLKEAGHSVMIAAPHTSNWDFPHAIAAFWIMGLDLKFFIKDFYTRSLFGFMFKWMGAIGVNRKKNNNLVDYAIELMKNNEQMVMLVPAEGTRKRVDEWKKGFYHIAEASNVPISLGYLDFKNKIAGIDSLVFPSGDMQADLEIIEKAYLKFTGKNHENYNPQIFKRG